MENKFDHRESLLLLQHGDSFFPSGSVAFSYGLESLAQDGLAANEEAVFQFLGRQIVYRWKTADWGVLACILESSANLERVFEADRMVEAMTLPLALREGSRRSAEAFLSVHTRLGSEAAETFRNAISCGSTPGHLVTAQGLIWSSLGLSLQQIGLLSLHGLAVGILGAAIRLGIIGHLAGQRTLSRLHPLMQRALNFAPPALHLLSSSTPIEDIAAMRHEARPTRLFSS